MRDEVELLNRRAALEVDFSVTGKEPLASMNWEGTFNPERLTLKYELRGSGSVWGAWTAIVQGPMICKDGSHSSRKGHRSWTDQTTPDVPLPVWAFERLKEHYPSPLFQATDVYRKEGGSAMMTRGGTHGGRAVDRRRTPRIQRFGKDVRPMDASSSPGQGSSVDPGAEVE